VGTTLSVADRLGLAGHPPADDEGGAEASSNPSAIVRPVNGFR
jgi:hypothetical protein